MKSINFFTKFNDLTLNDLKMDFHLHSTWTDGKNTIPQIIDYAKKNFLNSIAITDHIRMESTYFDKYQKEIKLLNEQEENFNVYVGFEAKVSDFNGNIDVQYDVVKQADIAIVSVHRYPLGNKLYGASKFEKSIAQEIELELALAAIKKGGFNVLGHAGGMSVVAFKEFPVEFYDKIITECENNDIAFDLSGRYHNSQIEILYPLLKKHNPYISIGTDAHSVGGMISWNKKLEKYIK